MDERSELQMLPLSPSPLGQVDLRKNMKHFTPRICPVFVEVNPPSRRAEWDPQSSWYFGKAPGKP